MKSFLKLFLIIIIAILIQACSLNNSSKFNKEDLQKLVENTKIEKLEKIEFDSEKNQLKIYIDNEFITKDDVDKIISTANINGKQGKSAFSKENFNNKELTFSILAKNENKIEILNASNDDYKLDIVNNKYSKNYISNELADLTKEISRFNDLAGRIQIDLKKHQKNEDRVNEFNNHYTNLLNNIEIFENNLKISEIENTEELISKLSILKNLFPIVKDSVDKAVANNYYLIIESQVLNINQIDKILRELKI